MSGDIGKWLVLLGYAAVLVVLVRPGSQGPTFVEDVGTAMSNLVTASTGGGTWSSGGSTTGSTTTTSSAPSGGGRSGGRSGGSGRRGG